MTPEEKKASHSKSVKKYEQKEDVKKRKAAYMKLRRNKLKEEGKVAINFFVTKEQKNKIKNILKNT